jgi:uncharacterized protein DUF4394
MSNENSTSLSWLWLMVPALCAGCGSDGTSDPAAGSDVRADTYAVTSNNRLLHFDRGSGAIRSASSIGGLGSGETIVGADFRPADATLYALSSGGKIYTIDTATGEATSKSTLMADPTDPSSPFSTLTGDVFGVNFNPVADRLRVVSKDGQNLRINVDTGATTTDAELNPGTPAISAAAYSNGFAAACRTRLYVIDTSANELLLQDPPNAGTLTKIAEIAAPAGSGDWAGFEIISDSDGSSSALALFPADQGTTIQDLDLATGELTNSRLLRLEPGESLRGLGAAPPAIAPAQAPGEIAGVTVSNQLVSFNRAAPGKLCTKAPISGLAANEDVLGIDVRPADGELYALGSSGALYTLDLASGAATVKSMLAPDPADTSAPFTSLPDGSVGIGFNPVPDRLRVVGSDGQSLRINVDTGAVNTDAPLSPTSMAINAVAYSNAYAGATSTALYAVDHESGSLVVIGGNPATTGACPDDLGNPNCGNVTSLGSLGVDDISYVDGFDIDGDPNASGLALLALSIGPAMSSSLYIIDLETGAAEPPTGVANPTIGGGERLRELTLTANPVVTAAP